MLFSLCLHALSSIIIHLHISSICPFVEDAGGVVSVKESAAAGPDQCAASPLPQDPDVCGLCSLDVQGFTRVQSMLPVHPMSEREVKGSFLTTSVLTLHALRQSRQELPNLLCLKLHCVCFDCICLGKTLQRETIGNRIDHFRMSLGQILAY